jgi:hypothetical protein
MDESRVASIRILVGTDGQRGRSAGALVDLRPATGMSISNKGIWSAACHSVLSKRG